MIEIEDMRKAEIEEILSGVGYGHLGCSDKGQPYVVPVHYAYDAPSIYVYTTEGKKTEIIRENPRVCLQVEKVVSNQDWKSVIVYGSAEQVSDAAERDRAIALVAMINPTLTPAVSIRWMDNWVRENIEVILKISSEFSTGRMSVDRGGGNVGVVPADETNRSTIL